MVNRKIARKEKKKSTPKANGHYAINVDRSNTWWLPGWWSLNLCKLLSILNIN